ncbi:adenylyl-sulfate kinase [Neotamlana laminarinivorans]|uniref:Adenylyl-sulfate kinase n=1 Tax=Neotamlana laminarinivorans TaxID=2883124 RepID=A0A9X1HY77_9FLAO|nr:adenylyl-sulfate kinase [Tamlana laminarinivorans]MCB4798319.1 adenylyl-sulfate kinase [Tamlana laminarinivorans]
MEKNIKKHEYQIGKLERQKLNGHNSFLIFFTGLSGSGKSTIANALEQKLNNQKIHTFALDGDNVRHGLNKDLSFAPEDRTENIRRIGETAKLFIDAGIVVLAAFVAPYEKDRKNIEDTVKSDNFVEVFVNTSLEECERRDVKGLYKKARAGEIKNMTGISAPYEAPQNPTVEVSHLNTVEESVEIIFQAIKNKLEIKEQ